MTLINQPFDGQFGNLLIDKLKEDYKRLIVVVAFARNSGVLRLKPGLERFRANGNKVQMFVGVDFQGTSCEALRNLLLLCDELYVIHSEDNSMTFHSKVFLLENEEKVWMAVGSNNLTASGLWTNLESCHCQEYQIGTPEFSSHFEPFADLIARYTGSDCEYSRKVKCESDIYELERSGYLIREAQQRINRNTDNARKTQAGGVALFGRPRRAGLPKVQLEGQTGKDVKVRQGETVRATHAIETSDDNERIWFETRRLTGGSRNILDLSKLGTVTSGAGNGSRYETDDHRFILGGVAFFDIEPEDVTIVKDITINYDGTDYAPCTIKYTPSNGSWRIQLKGRCVSGRSIHLIHGSGWLVDKILIFEKIRSDYYALSVLEPGNLPSCRAASYVVAQNGSARDSKEYGLFSF